MAEKRGTLSILKIIMISILLIANQKIPNIQIDKAINRIVLNDGKVLKLFYEKGFGKK